MSDSLISLRNVLTTVLGLMFEVGDSVFWIASVTSAYAGVWGRIP